MNVDEVIDEFVKFYVQSDSITTITWGGRPLFLSRGASEVDWGVGYIINYATDKECSQSRSEYVQGCKLWLNASRVQVAEWSQGLGRIAAPLMEFIRIRTQVVAITCDCGSRHNSGFHSAWCTLLKAKEKQNQSDKRGKLGY